MHGSPDYIDFNLVSSSDEKLQLVLKYEEIRNWIKSKEWIRGWSAYPREYPYNIYNFYFCFDFDDITMRHRFYNNYAWYASFKPTQKLKLNLLKQLGLLK